MTIQIKDNEQHFSQYSSFFSVFENEILSDLPCHGNTALDILSTQSL